MPVQHATTVSTLRASGPGLGWILDFAWEYLGRRRTNAALPPAVAELAATSRFRTAAAIAELGPAGRLFVFQARTRRTPVQVQQRIAQLLQASSPTSIVFFTNRSAEAWDLVVTAKSPSRGGDLVRRLRGPVLPQAADDALRAMPGASPADFAHALRALFAAALPFPLRRRRLFGAASPSLQREIAEAGLGPELSRLLAEPGTSREEERELSERLRAGDASAAHALVLRNTRFAFARAASRRGRGLPFADLLQQAFAGMLRAAQLYEPGYGVRYTTYAGFWVTSLAERSLEREHRSPPSAALRRVPPRRIRLSAADFEALLARRIDPAPGPAEQALDRLEREEQLLLVHRALRHTDARARAILFGHFGIGRAAPASLDELAAQFGITRERVRQIETRALRELRVRCLRANRERLDREPRPERMRLSFPALRRPRDPLPPAPGTPAASQVS